MSEAALGHTSGRFWCSALFSLIGKIAKEKNWYKATDMGIGAVRKNFVREASRIAREQEAIGVELSETKKIFDAFSEKIMPGWKWSEEEVSPEKMLLNQVGDCLMWNAIKEIGVQDKLRVRNICEAGCTGLVQVIDSNLIVDIDKAMCKGDKFCAFTVSPIQEELDF